jgi:hypothetical protein
MLPAKRTGCALSAPSCPASNSTDVVHVPSVAHVQAPRVAGHSRDRRSLEVLLLRAICPPPQTSADASAFGVLSHRIQAKPWLPSVLCFPFSLKPLPRSICKAVAFHTAFWTAVLPGGGAAPHGVPDRHVCRPNLAGRLPGLREESRPREPAAPADGVAKAVAQGLQRLLRHELLHFRVSAPSPQHPAPFLACTPQCDHERMSVLVKPGGGSAGPNCFAGLLLSPCSPLPAN